jgi:hypothetical protein
LSDEPGNEQATETLPWAWAAISRICFCKGLSVSANIG